MDVAYDLYLGECEGNENRYQQAARDVLTCALDCERFGVALIARVLDLQSPRSGWLQFIVLNRTSLGNVHRILLALAKQDTNLGSPRTCRRGFGS